MVPYAQRYTNAATEKEDLTLNPFSRGDPFDRAQRQGEFMSNAAKFAWWLALAVTIAATPPLHHHTVGHVVDLSGELYGAQWVTVTYWGWYIILYPLVFYATRASLATAIIGGATAVALRFV